MKHEEISISKTATISEALRQMDKAKRKLLIVINKDNTFFSLISIGDIQRAIINNKNLKTSIIDILRKEVKVAHVNDNIEGVKKHISIRRNDFMPVIDNNNNIIKVIFWEDLFGEKKKPRQFDLPVVIMAGGRGARMKPLTNIIPKPLIPIKEKTIVEDIMDSFIEHGSNKFYLSVNYKADLIRYYFADKNKNSYNIEYFEEPKPLGTAGSLSLLNGKISSTFFVSNCDILIDEDYYEMLEFHKKNQNIATVIAAVKQLPIPYGTIKMGKKGKLTRLNEKPELSLKINTGIYILEPEVLDLIPTEKFFHITELIEKLIKNKENVGVFPISEGSWVDIGEWGEYYKRIKDV